MLGIVRLLHIGMIFLLAVRSLAGNCDGEPNQPKSENDPRSDYAL